MPNDFNGFRVSPRVSSISFRSSPALADGVQGSRQAVAPAVDLLAAVDPAAGVAVADVETKLEPLEGDTITLAPKTKAKKQKWCFFQSLQQKCFGFNKHKPIHNVRASSNMLNPNPAMAS